MPRQKMLSISTKTKDDVPWPAISKLSPGKLTWTASALMSEWERSLRPLEKAHSVAEEHGVTKIEKSE